MKTIKNIYQKLISKEYIKEIILKSLKGKKYAKKVIEKLDKITETIYNNLVEFKFEMKPTKTEIVHDRKKDREITKSPYYPNKIYDYLIVESLYQMIEKSMYRWCVGNIKGRGKDMGIRYLERHIPKYKYAIKLDIKKFYDNIDKKILYSLLSKKITDKKFMLFYSKIVGNNGKGLSLGLNSSQWLSNFYLQDLDYFIKQKLKAKVYVRYVDDMVILGNNKKKLHYYIKEIKRFLWEHLRLTLKENYQLLNIEKDEDIEFLGYKVGKKRTNLVKPLFYRFVRLYRRMEDKSKRRAKTLVSLWGWFKTTTYSYSYYKKYLQRIIKFSKIKDLLRKPKTL